MSRFSAVLCLALSVGFLAAWSGSAKAAPPPAGIKHAPIVIDDEGDDDWDPDAILDDDGPTSVTAVGTLEQMEAFDAAHPQMGPLHVRSASIGRRNDPIGAGQPNSGVQPPLNGDVNAPPLGASFVGMIDNNTLVPPDTDGAVGPNHVFEFINTGRTIYNKAGAVVAPAITMQAFWSSLGTGSGQPAQSTSDPHVLYDQYAGRWLVSGIGVGTTNNWVLVAVSANSDPTSAYTMYAIKINVSTCGFNHLTQKVDFDLMGYDPNNVVITVNIFNSALTAFIHSDVYILNKARLIAGPAGQTLVCNTDFQIVHNPCNTPNGLGNIDYAPSISYGQTSGTAITYVVDNGWYDQTDLTVRYYRYAQITGVGATATYDCLGDMGFVQTSGCYNFNQAGGSQPNGCTAIATNGVNITCPPVVRNGKIWFTHSAGDPSSPCPDPAASPPATKSSVYWVEQDPANIIPGVADQFGVVTDANLAYYFPSLAVNSCDTVMLGFTSSGPNAGQFPSGQYTARVSSDPINTMQAVGTVKAGEGNYTKVAGGRNRWGDYSYTCVDPADDSTLWTIQEYARPGSCSGGTWATWWASMPAACCPTININPPTLPNATIGVFYNQSLTPSAGTTPFTFTLLSGTLPPGLSLSGAGVISGTPSSTLGTFNFTVKVTDNAGCTGTQAYTVSVSCAIPGDLNNDGLVNGLDIQHYANCVVGGSSPGGNCGCGDMNVDGFTNLSDLPAFLSALGV